MGGDQEPLERILKHDGVVHHPLGGGSYIFKEGLVEHITQGLSKSNLRISIGAQPNASPHFGTLVVFNLAFALGQKILEATNRVKPYIFFEVIDTAPSRTVTIDDVDYQISLRSSGESDRYLEEYSEVLDLLNDISGIEYLVRKQEDFNAQPNIPGILKVIVQNREVLAPLLDPQKGLLRIRVACPDCGLTDKKGSHNRFYDDRMESFCPEHKWFETRFDEGSHRFEYNTPLRNLVRALIYAKDNQDNATLFEWLRVTGSDYAGYYQEQLLYRAASLLGTPAHQLPIIVYAPLVLDWSGAKLSKSLYVKKGAYKDLPPYLVNYGKFKLEHGRNGMKTLFKEVSSWLEEPFKLFRHYSVYYFMEVLKSDR